jgi:transcriptional regulator with XRE-family HTH domain
MTQAQLAHALGGDCSQEVVSEVEHGRLDVPLALLEALASALRCKECDLLDELRRERRS